MTNSKFVARQAGLAAEETASRFLAGRGFEILARNLRTRRGEIDIVARGGGVTVFFEVKQRSDETFAQAEEAFTRSKAARFKRAVREVAPQFDDGGLMRADLLILLGDTKNPQIRHYENVLSFE